MSVDERLVDGTFSMRKPAPQLQGGLSMITIKVHQCIHLGRFGRSHRARASAYYARIVLIWFSADPALNHSI